jgi:hypothetical protein
VPWARSPALPDYELRRRIDSSVSRAIADQHYQKMLLSDPTIVLGHHGCTPQQLLELRGIRAHDIREFASQAEALFWPAADRPGRGAHRVLVAAAL